MSAARTSVACVVLLCVGTASARAAETIIDLPTALAAAKASGKPIFVYVFDST